MTFVSPEMVNPNQDVESFAPALWEALGNPSPVPQAFINLIGNWAHWEGSSATYNPMDTEEPSDGATDYNSVGVKNYPSLEAGVAATVATIRNGVYPYLEHCMKTIGTTDVDTAWLTALEHDINIWGTGNPQQYFPWTTDMLTFPNKYLSWFGSASGASSGGTSVTSPSTTTPPIPGSVGDVIGVLNSIAEQLGQGNDFVALMRDILARMNAAGKALDLNEPLP